MSSSLHFFLFFSLFLSLFLKLDQILRTREIQWDEYVKRVLELPEIGSIVNTEGICIDGGNVHYLKYWKKMCPVTFIFAFTIVTEFSHSPYSKTILLTSSSPSRSPWAPPPSNNRSPYHHQIYYHQHFYHHHHGNNNSRDSHHHNHF